MITLYRISIDSPDGAVQFVYETDKDEATDTVLKYGKYSSDYALLEELEVEPTAEAIAQLLNEEIKYHNRCNGR